MEKTEQLKDQIIRLQSDQIKNCLRYLEDSIPYGEFVKMEKKYVLDNNTLKDELERANHMHEMEKSALQDEIEKTNHMHEMEKSALQDEIEKTNRMHEMEKSVLQDEIERSNLAMSALKNELENIKNMYDIIVSSPSYKLGSKISFLLKKFLPVSFLRKVYYFILAVRKS